MTDDELQAIEARATAASDAPWDARGDMVRGADGRMLVGPGHPPLAPQMIQDAEFMAHARTDIPALLAEVRRLRALCGRAADKLGDHWDEGPPGEGWQSDNLKALIDELKMM